MKALLVATALALTTSLSFGQQWLTNYNEAARLAKKENKRLLINFTGSDWCGWCIKLDREVFSQPKFRQYAAHNLVLLKVDLPRRHPQPPHERRQNEALVRQYGVNGFPTIVVQSPGGKQLQRFGYVPGGPNAFIRKLEQSARYEQNGFRPGRDMPLRPGYRR